MKWALTHKSSFWNNFSYRCHWTPILFHCQTQPSINSRSGLVHCAHISLFAFYIYCLTFLWRFKVDYRIQKQCNTD